MKNYTLFFLLACLLIISCRKESLKQCSKPDTISLDGAVVIKEGTFVFNSSKFVGNAKIYQQKNGRYVVGLEEMDVLDNTDMLVYLSKTSYFSATSLKLFSARSISGNKYYLLPSGFVITDFSFILIMDDRQDEAIGTAGLN